ncbi:hypothetical protein CYY_003539 [Polysphondylium violaceum]|uniref:Fungal lipase-type domain-containing protein n=1 Tax=Polysphondylium violaceum TaxID=133409 RepID=A0A8J4V8K4_9MYCE|nr:hypothetical protein CYY_003539 [Polysphondylium violaceum]
MIFTKIVLLLLLTTIIGICHGSVIPREGDYIFGYMSDLAYSNDNITNSFRFIGLKDDCQQWRILLDIKDNVRMIIAVSVLSNNVIIAFKGSDDIGDYLTDVNILLWKCQYDKECGFIHAGFANAYNQIKDDIYNFFKGLTQEYDVYFTGHSLGGAIALNALSDFIARNKTSELPNISSITAVTFGQPPIGEGKFVDWINRNKDQYVYRRYVNINTRTPVEEYDPITYIPMYYHPNAPFKYQCRDNECPMTSVGLHSLDLYNSNIFNPKYSVCRTDCYFKSSSTFIYNKVFYCPTGDNSLIIGDYASKFYGDKFSVCRFNSKSEFNTYKYKAGVSCNSGTTYTSRLIDQKTGYIHNESAGKGRETFIVLENQNLIFPLTSFQYTVNFTQSVTPPTPPSNLTYALLSNANQTSDKVELKVNWDANHKVPVCSMKYNLYISEVGKTWTKHEYTESSSVSRISKIVSVLSKKVYTLVVTSDNGLESHPSNIVFIQH